MRIAAATAAMLVSTLASATAHAETVLMDQPGLRLVSETAADGTACALMMYATEAERDAATIALISAPFRAEDDLVTGLELRIVPTEAVTSLQIVLDDHRIEASSSQPFDLSEQFRPVLFDALLEQREVHLTARLTNGSYRSMRFQRTSFAEAFAMMHRRCNVDAERLEAMADLFAGEERALGLTRADLRNVAWKLHARYDKQLEPPEVGETLSDQTRALLLQYSREMRLSPSRYLHRDVLQRLSRDAFQPINWDHAAFENYATIRDWYTYTEGRGTALRCILETEARRLKGPMIWRYPHMRFTVKASEGDAAMLINLVTPNVFQTDRANSQARIDDDRFSLVERSGYILPVGGDGRFAADFLKSIQRGRRIVMRGPDQTTGEDLQIEFSALGFSAGFNTLIDRCQRQDLKAWLK